MSGNRVARVIGVVLLTAVISLGCVTARVENAPLEKYQPRTGYGANLIKAADDDKVRVVLAFSGGGTRAAALAYGVLKEIRDTKVVVKGVESRLLDQVTTVSSVSGGSFTAAYYGLKGDQIFEDFEEKFLRRDFNTRLGLSLLRPIQLFKIMFTPYTRSDMAMNIYDRKVFDGATFKDLEGIPGPVLNINATDIDVGGVFTFIQPNFDMICSDLSQMRISQAVTASSAVPGAFAPLLIKNWAGECGYEEPRWITEAFADPRASRRRYHQARTAATYLDGKERPYIFLVDGGVADNIGARRLLADVIDAGSVDSLAREQGIEIPEHLLYIVVNAQAAGHHQWQNRPKLPGLRDVLGAISGTGIYRYNFETVELLRESTVQWSSEVRSRGGALNAFVAEVAFDSLQDPDERKYFNGVRTSFKLSDEEIDRLIEVGGRLLRETPEYQEFLAGLK